MIPVENIWLAFGLTLMAGLPQASVVLSRSLSARVEIFFQFPGLFSRCDDLCFFCRILPESLEFLRFGSDRSELLATIFSLPGAFYHGH